MFKFKFENQTMVFYYLFGKAFLRKTFPIVSCSVFNFRSSDLVYEGQAYGGGN